MTEEGEVLKGSLLMSCVEKHPILNGDDGYACCHSACRTCFSVDRRKCEGEHQTGISGAVRAVDGQDEASQLHPQGAVCGQIRLCHAAVRPHRLCRSGHRRLCRAEGLPLRLWL